jgi:predicted nucleic acid-binding protein
VVALVDTSVLLRLRDLADPRHADCVAVFQPSMVSKHGLRLCVQAMIEYWVVATRPKPNNGFGLPPDVVAHDLGDLRSLVPCLTEPSDVGDHWLMLVTKHRVSGKPAHDARLVALMSAHNIRRLLTLNPSDFSRYPDVECVSPKDLANP